jgi:hypothetical protein
MQSFEDGAARRERARERDRLRAAEDKTGLPEAEDGPQLPDHGHARDLPRGDDDDPIE